MENKIGPLIVSIVDTFMQQGISVCYIDIDKERLDYFRDLYKYDHNFKAIFPHISGQPMSHYSIVIVINEHEFEPIFKKEYRQIAGLINNIKPMVINIEA